MLQIPWLISQYIISTFCRFSFLDKGQTNKLLWSLLVFGQFATWPVWLSSLFFQIEGGMLEMVNPLAEVVKGSHGIDNHPNRPVVWPR